jgi:hypothetical protein
MVKGKKARVKFLIEDDLKLLYDSLETFPSNATFILNRILDRLEGTLPEIQLVKIGDFLNGVKNLEMPMHVDTREERDRKSKAYKAQKEKILLLVEFLNS